MNEIPTSSVSLLPGPDLYFTVLLCNRVKCGFEWGGEGGTKYPTHRLDNTGSIRGFKGVRGEIPVLRGKSKFPWQPSERQSHFSTHFICNVIFSRFSIFSVVFFFFSEHIISPNKKFHLILMCFFLIVSECKAIRKRLKKWYVTRNIFFFKQRWRRYR